VTDIRADQIDLVLLFHGHSDNIGKHTDAKAQPRRLPVILCPLVIILGVSLNPDTTVPKQAPSSRVAFWVTLLRSVLAALLGLALILQPDKIRPILVNFMGMFRLASGIMSLRWGASGQRARRRSIFAGVIGIVGGLLVLSREIVRGVLQESSVIYILGGTLILTGLIHTFGGFRIGEDTVRQWSWTSLLLGVFEIILGILLFISSSTGLRPGIFVAATIWAFIGAFKLISDALRQRTRIRRQYRSK
jgi:uncharacterized membrane protein HdeD (DUF308 family)